ncbi:WD repeat and SOCS box-containing protein 2 isoform X1 [Brienomyrus brachyistius]|uniref:WD repeat and SOCS box-containing protein 2 isoform X1 n=2 Tax=Brienomyrus brachyistius TaxID=42636 RepID=UPI0020B3B30A|nr:WD repeat and SOCS box-containing protein 2 isoform X1 [Brienomyrus brachyistius]
MQSPPCSSKDERRGAATPGALMLELKPVHPPPLDGRAGCETWSVRFSPDGGCFAWSLGHGIVKLLPWPLQDVERHRSAEMEEAPRSRERTLQCGHSVWSLAFGPVTSKFASHTNVKGVPPELLLATGLNNGNIKIWEVATGNQLFHLTGHQGVVRDLAFTPNGSLTLVSGSRDKTLRIWDLSKPGNNFHVLTGHTSWVYSCSISPDSSMIASVCRGNTRVYLWSLRSYTFMKNLQGFDMFPVSCDFSPDGALLAIAAFATRWEIDVFDPHSGERLIVLRDCLYCDHDIMNTPIRAVCFSTEGLHLAFVTEDRAIRIWKLGQDNPAMETDLLRFSNGLCCTFHPHGGVVATGTRDGHVKFWRTPRPVPSLSHLSRVSLRCHTSTHQVMALPIPNKIKDFLTYRNLRGCHEARCGMHQLPLD